MTVNSENVEGTAQDTHRPDKPARLSYLSKQGRPENKSRPLPLTLTLRAVLPKLQVPVSIPFLPCCKLIPSKPDLDAYRSS